MTEVYLTLKDYHQPYTYPVDYYPENGKTGKELVEYVRSLIDSPRNIITSSLFLLRELHIQDVPCRFYNNGRVGESIDDIGNIEVLDMELEQSGRYMDKENKYEN